jgi:F0F1-type ATP synthase membrane subunit b/b'
MANSKLLLLALTIVIITLTAGTSIALPSIEDMIAQAQARAQIEAAIAEARANVETAIAQAQAQTEEIIDQALSQTQTQIEDAIAQTQAQIDQLITNARTQINDSIDEITIQVDQAINEDLNMNETIVNDVIIRINMEIDQARTQTEQAINDDLPSCQEKIHSILARLKEKIDDLLAIIRGTVTEQTTDTGCIIALIEYDIKRAIVAIANRLDQTQIKTGDDTGSWPNEADQTGSIVAGMVRAYEVTGDNTYKASAELGGNYIISVANGNFRGDEAFALSLLSQISDSPSDNPWRTALYNFYSDIKNDVNETEGYIISRFSVVDLSTAVFQIANHVVAAYLVNAEDKEIWREALIDCLVQVDDCSCDCPVMLEGIATWALAVTGPLSDALIDSSPSPTDYWCGKKFADLPALILSHQVHDGEPNTGCFYRLFGHSKCNLEDHINGYTEDAIFSTIGLVRASQANPALDLEAAICAALRALLEGINSEGKVFELLSAQEQSTDCYIYGGEMLQVLGEYIINGCPAVLIQAGGC